MISSPTFRSNFFLNQNTNKYKIGVSNAAITILNKKPLNNNPPKISHGKTLKEQKIENATDFSLYLLEHANVATVTGSAFGNPDCIRISYAASQDQIIEAIKRIKQAVS